VPATDITTLKHLMLYEKSWSTEKSSLHHSSIVAIRPT